MVITQIPHTNPLSLLILLLKSQIRGYTRKDGTYVKPHSDKRQRAARDAGQMDMFRPAPAERSSAPRPNPYKGKDPDLDVPDLFSGKTRREEDTRRVILKSSGDEDLDHLIREHERLVAVLNSPSHDDDRREAARQEEELRGYKRKAKRQRTA